MRGFQNNYPILCDKYHFKAIPIDALLQFEYRVYTLAQFRQFIVQHQFKLNLIFTIKQMKSLTLALICLISLMNQAAPNNVNYLQVKFQDQVMHLSRVKLHNKQQKSNKMVSANWMSYLNDDAKVSQISIPGTHDTGTFRCTSQMPCEVYQCQSWSIYQQLKNGIRYLDLRVNSQIPLTIGHQNVYFMTFMEVLADTFKFLHQHPSQFLIFAFQRNTGDIDRNQEIFQALKSYHIPIVFRSHLDMPKVGELRGKVWIFNGLGITFKEDTFVMNGVMGITNTEAIYLQNYWEVYPENITQKVQYSKQTAFYVDCEATRMKINFLSGSVGISPFLLAKHEQGPNVKLLQTLKLIPNNCLGISVIDFPEIQLIQAIVNSNFQQPLEEL